MKKWLSFLSICCLAVVLIFNACDDKDSDDPISVDDIDLNLITEGLTSPLVLVESPDNSGRLFVVDQPGQIYIIKDGERLAQPFLDIQSKMVPLQSPNDERGLLGLAFHPNFQNNGRFFVFYSAPLRSTAPNGWDHTNVVSEFKVMTGNADQGEIGSERIILEVDHPQGNHNAGMIAFGPDGNLYISIGDGGGAHDTAPGHVEDWYDGNAGGNGQDISQNLLGNILRIDVNLESLYGIPTDNPFIGDDNGRDEIYAFGLRNPYRFCFDPDGQIILADAGQELYEEIDLVVKGGNYGWNVKEGRHCFDAANPSTPLASCPSMDEDGNPLIDPVIEFKNSKSFSDGLGIVGIGGYVYQGDDVSSLDGKYIFGVFAQQPQQSDGAIFAANRSGNDWDYKKLRIKNMDNREIGMFVLGFGQDNDGEIYVLTKSTTAGSGKVFKID